MNCSWTKWYTGFEEHLCFRASWGRGLRLVVSRELDTTEWKGEWRGDSGLELVLEDASGNNTIEIEDVTRLALHDVAAMYMFTIRLNGQEIGDITKRSARSNWSVCYAAKPPSCRVDRELQIEDSRRKPSYKDYFSCAIELRSNDDRFVFFSRAFQQGAVWRGLAPQGLPVALSALFRQYINRM